MTMLRARTLVVMAVCGVAVAFVGVTSAAASSRGMFLGALVASD